MNKISSGLLPSLIPAYRQAGLVIILYSTIFGRMRTKELKNLVVEQRAIASRFLNRYVILDLFLPRNISDPSALSLLLVNDGQNLEDMQFSLMLDQLFSSGQITPLVCCGIHAGRDRKNEYGTVDITDYEGRGAKAASYESFVMEELLPFIHLTYAIESFRSKGFAGFSLGGLTALDLTWRHPDVFTIAGVFSGSLWWRTRDLDKGYNEDTDRIMHHLVREGKYVPGLRFYFTTGSLDETADRNNNGIIDSIDDTLSLIQELKTLGYDTGYDIRYLNDEEGRHDVPTWGKAMPGFLLWGWGDGRERERGERAEKGSFAKDFEGQGRVEEEGRG